MCTCQLLHAAKYSYGVSLKIIIFFFLMIRLPSISTRTDPLFPYTTLVRSAFDQLIEGARVDVAIPHELEALGGESLIPSEGLVYRVGVDAGRRDLPADEIGRAHV